MYETIKQGSMVFISDGDTGIGSVRQIAPEGKEELVIYIENAGDFLVPFTVVDAIHEDKVILNCDRIPPRLRTAINHARDAEDREFVEHAPAGEQDQPLSVVFIEQQRQRLEALRAELLGGEDSRSTNARQEQETHGEEAQEFEEQAQDMVQSEIRQALHNVDVRRLNNIKRALQKIAEGSYGLSDLSGDPIPKARLEITPEANLTVEEEQRKENG